MKETQKQKHNISPIFNSQSKILILGSFPSVKSRENCFYYHHPQNRFWKVLSYILEEKTPETIEEKKNMLLRNHIALWDVIESCEIAGSADSTIQNVTPNNLTKIFQKANIQKIFLNGGTAYRLYQKHMAKNQTQTAIKLPSTSSANAGFSFEKLVDEWKIILQEINN